MGMTSQQLLSELRENTGTDIDDVPDDIALLLLNRSFWELLNKVHFTEKERVIPFSTMVGVKKYRTPVTFEAIIGITMIDPTSQQFSRLDSVGEWTYDNEHNDDVINYAQPTKYFRQEQYIVLEPTPDIVYNLNIRHNILLQDVDTAGSELTIPREWHEIILYGGCYRLFVRLGDLNRASQMRNIQGNGWNSLVPTFAKETADQHNAHFEVKGYDGNYV